MNIEIIVKVHRGAEAGYQADVFEVKESETVIEDRKPKYGEPDYGRPVAEHPWARAEKVLDHLSDRVRGKARGALQERCAIEAVALRAAQAAWDEEHAEPKSKPPAMPTGSVVPADVPF